MYFSYSGGLTIVHNVKEFYKKHLKVQNEIYTIVIFINLQILVA